MKVKKIMSVALIFLIGALTGGAAGAYVTMHFASLFYIDGSILQDVVSIKQNIAALQKIRQEKIDGATEILEGAVDSTLIRYSFDLRGSRHIRQTVISSLKTVKEYREKYPRTTKSPKIDEAVARALVKADE
jgi:gas vesicle protein